MSPASRVAITVLGVAAVAGVFIWWRRAPAPPPPAPPVTRIAAPAASSPPVPAKPAVQHPIEPATVPPRNALPALDDSDAYLKNALGGLLGRKNVLSFLVVDGIARRFVATVNNLATDNAAAEMWPVNRTAGHLITETRADTSVLGGGNTGRYAGFVHFVEAIDTRRAVAMYMDSYPLLQRAYEDLGFPDKYFNDRVVEVIDHLLATPDVAEPIKVKRVQVDGSTKPQGSGGLYLFEDPTLEVSSSGQKILLRMGRQNAGKLKAKLADIRLRIANGPATVTVTRTPVDR